MPIKISSVCCHTRRALPRFLVLLLLFCIPRAASAAPAGLPECPHGRITAIFIDNHSVFDLSDPDLDSRFAWAFRTANRLHIPTREEVIRRELLFEPGDCYDTELLNESERILRRSAFLARVDIFGVRQPDGSHHVVVDTQDDWSTRIDMQLEPGGGLMPIGIRMLEENFLGTGQQVSAFYLRSFEQRVYGLSYLNPQIFGSRWRGGVQVGRTPTGYLFAGSLLHPFVGEAGRWAIRNQVRHSDRLFEYIVEREDGRLEAVFLPERRRAFEVGGALRLGQPGALTVLGAAVGGEWISYPDEPRLELWESNPVPVPPFPWADSVANVRAMVLAGRRNIRYVRRQALETVRAVEDVRLGTEIELGLGRTLPGLATDQDYSLDFGFFAAGQPLDAVHMGTRLRLEGKRDLLAAASTPEWHDLFGQFDAWTYWRPSPDSRHTVVAGLAMVGGWNTRVPFQLTLGGAAGLRGYSWHRYPGGQRAVFSLEQRSYLGWPLPQLLDLGSAVFFDIGRSWAGDVPFGRDSPYLANVGVGLRGAFPPGSPNTARLDLAAPLQADLHVRDLVFSVGLERTIGGRVWDDPQLRRSLRQGIATTLFMLPDDRSR